MSIFVFLVGNWVLNQGYMLGKYFAAIKSSTLSPKPLEILFSCNTVYLYIPIDFCIGKNWSKTSCMPSTSSTRSQVLVSNAFKYWLHFFYLLLHLKDYFLCVYVYVVMHTMAEVRITWGSSTSLSTMWVLGIKFRLGSKCLYLTSHFTGPYLTVLTLVCVYGNEEWILGHIACYISTSFIELLTYPMSPFRLSVLRQNLSNQGQLWTYTIAQAVSELVIHFLHTALQRSWYHRPSQWFKKHLEIYWMAGDVE